MLNVVLYQPEMPANTGNIIRLCANAGVQLHIIFPIPFRMDEKSLARASLDYAEFVNIKYYEDYEDFKRQHPNARVFALTTKTTNNMSSVTFQDGDFLMFGPESRGLPEQVREEVYERIRIPMQPVSRSLNLSNSVAICVYEALRQLGYPGCK